MNFFWYPASIDELIYVSFKANWVDHSKSLREQGIIETEILTIKRKLFIGTDANEEIDNPIQRNMQYEQVIILIR